MDDNIEFSVNTINNLPKPKTLERPTHKEDSLGAKITKELQNFDIDKMNEELDNRLTIQYIDKRTGIPTFNALSKNVLIRDDDGKEIIINNQEEIKKIQRKNKIELNNKLKPVELAKPIDDDEIVEFE